jgi:hypothetical protein
MLRRRTLFALLTAVMLAPLALFAQLQPARSGTMANGNRLAGYIAPADSVTPRARLLPLSAVAPRLAAVSHALPDSSPHLPALRLTASRSTFDSVAFGPKSASTAFVLSFLIAGGGQLYAGETKKGVVLMATELVGAGLVVHELATCDELLTGGCDDVKLGLGAVLAVGSWVVSMVDAPGAARRYNEKHGRAQPIVDIEPGLAARFGVRVALGR